MTDKPQYVAGQPVQACVRVILSKPIALTRLYAQVTGLEKSCVEYIERETRHYTDSDGNSKTETIEHRRYEYAERIFYSQECQLSEFGGQIVQPGTLDYTVNFQLPVDGLSTFHIQRGRDYAHIFYEVEVRLQRPGIMKWDKVSAAEVDVVAPSNKGPPTALMV